MISKTTEGLQTYYKNATYTTKEDGKEGQTTCAGRESMAFFVDNGESLEEEIDAAIDELRKIQYLFF